ncbi:MAG: methyltransferase [Deltaproteobacteria bacterium]|nr:methyltransferase [Deltaproteobacteria bacterium]
MVDPSDTGRFTKDALYEGRLTLHQPRRGYRFSVDAPLLTWFAYGPKPAASAVDLGAGCGVIGLGLLASGGARTVTAIEVQPELAALCARNAAANGLEGSCRVVEANLFEDHPDLRPGSYDLIVSNPPFSKAGTGRLPENPQRKLACCEVTGDLEGWIGAAARLASRSRGRLAVVFPARRLDDLMSSFGAAGLAATRLRMVHPKPGAGADLVLAEARIGSPGRLSVEPPLVLRDEGDKDTEETAAILSGRFSLPLRALPDKRRG